jgi:transcriptional regulator with XRE-family HTH domain
MTPDQLKALRARLGLTQAQLAEKLGVERNTVNRWEMGLLPIQTITALAVEHLRCLAKPNAKRRKVVT